MTVDYTQVDFDELPTYGIWLAWHVDPDDEESDYNLLRIPNANADFDDGVEIQNVFNTTVGAGQNVQPTSKTIFNPTIEFTAEDPDIYDYLTPRIEFSDNVLVIDDQVHPNMAFEGRLSKIRFGDVVRIRMTLRQVEPPYTGGGGVT